MQRLFKNVEVDPFGPPKSPGVYAVCKSIHGIFKEKILYIGSAQNIFIRVMSLKHHYRILLDKSSYPILIYVKSIETEDYKSLEKVLIRLYKPKLNTHHTNG